MNPVLHLRRPDWVLGLILLVITLAAYQPAWNGTPLWDDDAHITTPELRSFHGLVRIWTEPGATQQYYPLVHSAFWVAHRLFGNATTGYHLLNILLHVLSALLLVKILRYLGVAGALLAGAIFALHPVMVESVAWITELKNTLSGVFFLATALVYLKFDRERCRRLYWLAFALFVFALLSKSVTAILPVPLCAVFWWKRGTLRWKEDIVPLLPFFALGIVSGLFTAWMESEVHGARGEWYRFTIIERCLIAGRVVWFYAGKLFFPVNLMFIYPRWEVSQSVWWQYLFPVGALAAAAAFWTLRKLTRAPLAVFICYTAALFPVLGFFNVYPFRFSFVADHFQYLACIGPIAAGAAAVHALVNRAWNRPSLLKPAAYAALSIILGVLTWRQSIQYTDAETLYMTTLRKNPACWLAYNNLGLIMANAGRTDEALARYRKTLEINPAVTETRNNIGNLFQKAGRTDEAITQYRKALEINPDDVASNNNLGSALLKTGRTDEAMACFRRALKADPNNAKTRNNLCNVLMKTGRSGEAIDNCRKALALDPFLVEAHNNLGILLAQTGRLSEAASHFRKGLEIDPASGENHYNYGILLAMTGKRDEAVFHYLKALEITPDHAEACNNLAILLKENGRTDEAVAYYCRALEIKPEYLDARINLGNIMLQAGRMNDAAECYLKVLEKNPWNINALSGLSGVYLKNGQPARAVQVLKKGRSAAASAGQEAMAAEISKGLEQLNHTITASAVKNHR